MRLIAFPQNEQGNFWVGFDSLDAFATSDARFASYAAQVHHQKSVNAVPIRTIGTLNLRTPFLAPQEIGGHGSGQLSYHRSMEANSVKVSDL
ncbi:hypothetical protein [Roseobacter fucihabitans]|uniref:hypothetical protein n=1 Tax=Roseobacter fucihabitans TaxID=1537242 RepID=UPI001652C087|nr:hypothetical protein [Roseobacter litoralis]